MDIEVIFGKRPGSQLVPSKDMKVPMWKKKTIFWELPYSEILEVHNAIDAVHLTKNICINHLGFLGTYGKTKDTLEARQDLQYMKQWNGRHPEKREKGSHYLLHERYSARKCSTSNHELM